MICESKLVVPAAKPIYSICIFALEHNLSVTSQHMWVENCEWELRCLWSSSFSSPDVNNAFSVCGPSVEGRMLSPENKVWWSVRELASTSTRSRGLVGVKFGKNLTPNISVSDKLCHRVIDIYIGGAGLNI